ncbi:MAG: histidine phosphatase family protein [Anaerolineales bacterium]
MNDPNHHLEKGRPMPKKIYLMRHGKSTWNEIQKTSGQTDPPLAPKGLALAERLAKVLVNEPLTAIYSSTLKRSIETARPTADCHGLPIHQERDLQEQNLGDLEGRYRDERDPEAEELWAKRTENRVRFVPPNGETYAALEERVGGCLNNILRDEAGGEILIVGHRITNRVLMQALLDLSAADAEQLSLRSKFLYEIAPGKEPMVHTILLSEHKAGKRHEGLMT